MRGYLSDIISPNHPPLITYPAGGEWGVVGRIDNSYDTESPAVGEAAYPRVISPIVGQADNKVLLRGWKNRSVRKNDNAKKKIGVGNPGRNQTAQNQKGAETIKEAVFTFPRESSERCRIGSKRPTSPTGVGGQIFKRVRDGKNPQLAAV